MENEKSNRQMILEMSKENQKIVESRQFPYLKFINMVKYTFGWQDTYKVDKRKEGDFFRQKANENKSQVEIGQHEEDKKKKEALVIYCEMMLLNIDESEAKGNIKDAEESECASYKVYSAHKDISEKLIDKLKQRQGLKVWVKFSEKQYNQLFQEVLFDQNELCKTVTFTDYRTGKGKTIKHHFEVKKSVR